MDIKLLFGSYLVKKRLITEVDMLKALTYQSEQTPSFIDVALRFNLLDRKRVYEVLTHQADTDLSFEEVAVHREYLTLEQMLRINEEREKARPPLGEILVEFNKLDNKAMLAELEKFHRITVKYHEISAMLKKAKIFSRIGESALDALAFMAEKEVFDDGARITTEGAEANCFYYIASGAVKVTKQAPVPDGKESFVSTLGENDTFGESALFEENKRSVSVTADGDTVLLRFERGEFMEFLRDHPKAAIHVLTFFIEGLLEKLHDAHRQLILERGN
jgi:hypothetical protein